jgi:hypothetical protein
VSVLSLCAYKLGPEPVHKCVPGQSAVPGGSRQLPHHWCTNDATNVDSERGWKEFPLSMNLSVFQARWRNRARALAAE